MQNEQRILFSDVASRSTYNASSILNPFGSNIFTCVIWIAIAFSSVRNIFDLWVSHNSSLNETEIPIIIKAKKLCICEIFTECYAF